MDFGINFNNFDPEDIQVEETINAVFVVDVRKEHIAVKEAQKLNIPIFAMVDTNSNPNVADFPIPANDDAYKSIDIVVKNLTKSVEEGLLERKKDKDDLRKPRQVQEKNQLQGKGEYGWRK